MEVPLAATLFEGQVSKVVIRRSTAAVAGCCCCWSLRSINDGSLLMLQHKDCCSFRKPWLVVAVEVHRSIVRLDSLVRSCLSTDFENCLSNIDCGGSSARWLHWATACAGANWQLFAATSKPTKRQCDCCREIDCFLQVDCCCCHSRKPAALTSLSVIQIQRHWASCA